MSDRDLMQQALDAMMTIRPYEVVDYDQLEASITALRERLAQPEREWVGLTLKEILINRHLIDWTSERSYLEFAREIEKALKEKNT